MSMPPAIANTFLFEMMKSKSKDVTLAAIYALGEGRGNGKQIRAGIADGNTGLTTVHHWHHGGGQRTVCGHHAAGKKQAAKYYCRIIFSHRLFPRNYPARSPRFPASE